MHGFHQGAWEHQSLQALESVPQEDVLMWEECVLPGAFLPALTMLLHLCLQRPSGAPRRAWTPFSAPGGARVVVPRHEAAKAISGAWAPGHEGSIPGLQSHAFRPEAAPDAALQRPEQELLCHPHSPAGQQCHRMHAVRGEHGAGVPGGGGPEAGAARGEEWGPQRAPGARLVGLSLLSRRPVIQRGLHRHAFGGCGDLL